MSNSRIIKFRAWDKNEKRMLRVKGWLCAKEVIVLDWKLRGEEAVRKGIDFKDMSPDREVLIEEVELMQFTGLKDKNGKEIYCSDILKHPDIIDSEFYVRWNNERAKFQLENKEGKELMGQLFGNEYFVIGNEYEGLQSSGEGDIKRKIK